MREVERKRRRRGVVGDVGRLEMEREEEDGFSLRVRILGREGDEEDLEGVIPQGPSGNTIVLFLCNSRLCCGVHLCAIMPYLKFTIFTIHIY